MTRSNRTNINYPEGVVSKTILPKCPFAYPAGLELIPPTPLSFFRGMEKKGMTVPLGASNTSNFICPLFYFFYPGFPFYGQGHPFIFSPFPKIKRNMTGENNISHDKHPKSFVDKAPILIF